MQIGQSEAETVSCLFKTFFFENTACCESRGSRGAGRKTNVGKYVIIQNNACPLKEERNYFDSGHRDGRGPRVRRVQPLFNKMKRSSHNSPHRRTRGMMP